MMVTNKKYTLPPKIEAELMALPVPTASDFLERLQCVPIEVVVIARRQVEDQMIRDQIDSILVGRSVPRILAAVKRRLDHGMPFEELDEAQDEAMVLFWEEIQRESFFEVQFNSATAYLAKRAWRNIGGSKQQERERSALRIDSTGPEESDGRDTVTDVPDDTDGYAQFENRYLIQIGLASLSAEQAKAITLHFLFGLQIYSSDSAVRTVATELGCGERKARKLIADGKAAMKATLSQEDYDE